MYNLFSNVDLLSDLVSRANAVENGELEIRFSDVVKKDLFPSKRPANERTRPASYNFRPSVSAVNFERVSDAFEHYGLPGERCQSVDTFYKMRAGQSYNILRNTLSKDDATGDLKSYWLLKKRSRPVDIWNLNIRLSFATEKVVDRVAPPNIKPFMVRRKLRRSHRDGCARYDLTKVDTEYIDQNSPEIRSETTFEIEIEYVPQRKSNDSSTEIAKHLLDCTHRVLVLLQDSPAICTLAQSHNAMLEYCVIASMLETSRPRFIGAQPETLHKRHLPIIKKPGLYSLTEKYDGDRYLLFFNDQGTGYLIGRNSRIKSSGIVNDRDKGSILDVEYVNGALYAFDILFDNGRDLRGDITCLLKDRLKRVRRIVRNTYDQNKENDRCIPLFTKEYHFADFEMIISAFGGSEHKDDGRNADERNANVAIASDGFIYTPVKECYPSKPKWNTLLKWKPPELNSIDFAVKVSRADDGKLELYVGDKDGILIPFAPHPTVLKRNFDIGRTSDANSSTPLVIVECVWNKHEMTFVPIRERIDKNVPNFVTVALDVWESINNPVHLNDLVASPFVNMRKCHNQIKTAIAATAVNGWRKTRDALPKAVSWGDVVEDDAESDETVTLKVLDLACGRGGDLWKWSNCLATDESLFYVGVDVNGELLSEAKRRSQQVVDSRNVTNARADKLEHHFYEMDLRSDVFDGQRKFDVVSCQFALHYFYRSKSTFDTFLRTMCTNTDTGSMFIATLFDGEQVFRKCVAGTYRKTASMGMNEYGFEITARFRDGVDDIADPHELLKCVRQKRYGNAILAGLVGDSDVILKKATEEYLVFADDFIMRMREANFVLLESRLFKDADGHVISSLKDRMNEIETEYSNLHRYYIFQRVEDAQQTRSSWRRLNEENSAILRTLRQIGFEDAVYERECDLLADTTELCCEGAGDAPCSCGCVENVLEMVTGENGPDWRVDFVNHTNTDEILQTLAVHFVVCLVVFRSADRDDECTWKAFNHEALRCIYVNDSGEGKHLHVLGFSERRGIVQRLKPNMQKVRSDDDASASSSFMGKPIFGGKNAWTVKALQDHAKQCDIRVPSAVRKKQDIVEYIRRQLGRKTTM